ncbi:UNVERIFIED_CONTAM: hypothetical protein Scaly_1181700 [Sesamum calycinum]|uniref:Late embryogenesis abundant protein LEA-2 subgroup domain-containing protein n=1 Tax=Sesamum calycinum TaxID=2727403 RepID=A0AAW2Q3S4_9LAMI
MVLLPPHHTQHFPRSFSSHPLHFPPPPPPPPPPHPWRGTTPPTAAVAAAASYSPPASLLSSCGSACRTYKPTCSIEHFYVPSLNTTDNSSAARNNHTLYFDLKLKNGMKDKAVYYANINLTFFYTQNTSTIPVANYTVPAFHQGHEKKAHRKELVGASGLPWTAALQAVSNGSTGKLGGESLSALCCAGGRTPAAKVKQIGKGIRSLSTAISHGGRSSKNLCRRRAKK